MGLVVCDIDGTVAAHKWRFDAYAPIASPYLDIEIEHTRDNISSMADVWALDEMEKEREKWVSERRYRSWDRFHQEAYRDNPIKSTKRLLHMLKEDHEIIFATGRQEKWFEETAWWIETKLHLPIFSRLDLWMREEGDYRPNHEIKLDMLDGTETLVGEPVSLWIDDNQKVAETLPCVVLLLNDEANHDA